MLTEIPHHRDGPVITYLNHLNELFKGLNWFISGSFASTLTLRPNDIDVYFYTANDFHRAVSRCAKSNTWFSYATSDSASCWSLKYNTGLHDALRGTKYGRNIPLQLISKTFGNPEEVLDTFDLNICKIALTPTGKTLIAKEFNEDPLKVVSINSDTYFRVIKYVSRYYGGIVSPEAISALERVIDDWIEDTTVVENYYGETTSYKAKNLPSNSILFDTFLEIPCIREYLLKEAKRRAPELLI